MQKLHFGTLFLGPFYFKIGQKMRLSTNMLAADQSNAGDI